MKKTAFVVAALLAAAPAHAVTFHEFPANAGLDGTEIVPLEYAFGGGVYQTQRTTVGLLKNFISSAMLASANTWTLGQIFSAQSQFTVAPVFASLTGYCYANASAPITCSATIPMSAITGTLPAAQLPTPTASTLGGVKSSTAGSHQFATGIDTAGAVTYAQPAFTDISGSLAFGSITGTIVNSQIGASAVALSNMADMTANSVIGNNAASPAAPVALSPSSVLDIISSTQGSILYRDASGWFALGPGASGQFLKTQGAGANPLWAPYSGGTTFTLLATLTGLSGSTQSATSLTAYSEYFVTFSNVTISAPSGILVRVSTNNGSSYTDVGGIGQASSPIYGTASITGANANIAEFRSVGSSTSSATSATFGSDATLGYFSLAAQINALQFAPSGTTFAGGGTIKIYGR